MKLSLSPKQIKCKLFQRYVSSKYSWDRLTNLVTPNITKQTKPRLHAFAKRSPSPSPELGEKATLRINTPIITARRINSALSAGPERQIHPHSSRSRSKITSSVKPSLTTRLTYLLMSYKLIAIYSEFCWPSYPQEVSFIFLYITAMLDCETCREEA